MAKALRKPILILALVGAVVLGGGWLAGGLLEQARIGTAFVAKMTCSCRFVSRRSVRSCETDYDAKAVRPLTREMDAGGITVSALGHLVSARAVFEPGFGCHLVN